MQIARKKIRSQITDSRISGYISNSYYSIREYDSAIEYLNQAFEVFKNDVCIRMNLEGEKHVKSYFQVALTYMKMNNLSETHDFLGRSLAEFECIGNHGGIIDCLRYRSNLFKYRGRNDLDTQELRRCLDLIENNEELYMR